MFASVDFDGWFHVLAYHQEHGKAFKLKSDANNCMAYVAVRLPRGVFASVRTSNGSKNNFQENAFTLECLVFCWVLLDVSW
jgi:hypothetical protein